MEFKVIIYIIAGILYFLYTVGKKAEEKKKSSVPSDNTPPVSKPVSPPVANPLEDIMREIKRKQAEAETQKKATVLRPKPFTAQTQKPQKELLVRETKKPVLAEGASDYEPTYQRELTAEEKIERGNIHLKNEGIYKLPVAEETQNEQETFHLNVREAFIGSFIFERKY